MGVESSATTQLETDSTLIEAELQRLLRHKKFSAAGQMSAFLHYIVTQTLEGNGDRIKAYTVGVDALGKPDSFDAQNDPSVRVLALRLRKCLNASYDDDNDGLHHARIVLKVGTYVPEFQKAAPTPQLVGHAPLERQTSVSHLRTSTLNTSPCESATQDADVSTLASKSALYDDDSNNASASVKLRSPGSTLRASSWLVGGTLLLIVIGWTVNAWDNDSFATCNETARLHPASSQGLAQEGPASLPEKTATKTATQDSQPTLYIPVNDSDSEHEKQMSVLLGSSVVQQGAVDVVRVSQINSKQRIIDNGYWMVIDEIPLDGQSAVVVQLLRQNSGAVVLSTTLTLHAAEVGLSTEHMRWIEALARDISHVDGPLFQDHRAELSLQASGTGLQVAEMVSENL